MMKNIKGKGVTLALLILFSACKKLDLAPVDRFTDLTYWTTSEKAKTVLNTAYSQMFNNNYFFLNEALSDNAYNSRGDNEGVASIAAGIHDPSLSRFNNEWDNHYSGIKTCNVFLENVDKVTSMDAGLRERMKGEIRFIRAFQYFQLYTWFGDVPLFDKDITLDEAKTIGRTPRAQVVEFVLKELDAAAAILPVNTAYANADKGRITKGAALALKARVLLYEGRWQDVVTACEQVMSGTNGTYSLFSSYEGLFLPQNEYNNEVILDLGYVPLLRTYSNFFDYAPISVGARLNNFAPTQELVDSYLMTNGKTINEAGSGYDENNPYVNRDPRLTATVVYHNYQWKKPDGTTQTIYIKPGSDPNQTTKLDEYAPGSVASATGYYLRKYYDPTSASNFQSGLNLILIRYADILLMYAEAKNELGQMTSDVWDRTVRALRARAGFTDAAALTYNATGGQAGLRSIIRNERRTELGMEGLRIFDIRRWRTAETVLNGWAHGAKYGPAAVDNGYIRANQRVFDPAKHYLWPIPREERNLNPNLTQNPGW
ncbi:RagB/SusD family nutrient uptake outer membrane protein [Mucilaginibacter daejeonensis]|uniref:RagB/SusD family nutrient uptake outer membrane protein n=1 Tax=Mucilaginibacter daejeonensis TaxID=398049 RepID=UPI001D176709|nr:RagB/SusD family nutrient uptake outer membrane protein [Mucilaginibacter daejeonensis]UEG55192.1 RagB/SusD family nutrient uptake outer membrane protein [Mucilaginibacter daejeonensis]